MRPAARIHPAFLTVLLPAFLVLCLAALAGLPRPVQAAEPDDGEAEVVRPDQNTIYIPYKDLEKVFEKTGRGVFLPYEKFLELWKKSRPPVLEGKEAPPLPAAVTAASYSGKVKEKTASFTAVYQIEAFKEGWSALPFPLENLAVSSVKTPEEGVILAAGEGGGYRLLVQKPGTYRLEIAFAVKVEEEEGEKFFRFKAPAASVARLEAVLPGGNLKITLKPNLAASETPVGDDATRLLAFLGPNREVEVRWRTQAERLAVREAILHPEVLTKVKIEEGSMEMQATLRYEILQAPADRFRILLPPDFLLISYDRANLLSADVKEEAEGKVLDLKLHTGAKESFVFHLRMQRAFTGEMPDTLAVPVVQALGARREEGSIAVDLTPPLTGQVSERSGLSQIDVNDLPAPLKAPDTDFAFNYLKRPVSLSLSVEKEKPELTSELRGKVFVTEGRIEFTGRLDVAVERSGVFGVRWMAPAGYEIQKLYLRRPGDLNRTVSEGEAGRRWIEVTFPSKTKGKIGMHFELRKERKEALTGAFRLPWFRVPDAKKDRGWVAVRTKEGYDLRVEGELEGYESRNVSEIVRQTGGPALLGFVYNLSKTEDPAETAFRANLEVTKRPSRVTAKIYTLLDVKDTAVEVIHDIRFEIKQAGVDAFTYSFPAWIKPGEEGEKEAGGKRWDVLDPEVKNRKQVTETVDEEKGRRVWKVEIQKERMGEVAVKVRTKLALEDLEPGQALAVEVPDLQVHDVFQATGYLAFTKGDNIVLMPAPTGGKLYKADVAELPASLKEKNPFTVYRYTELPWGMKLGVTKYEYEKALPTVVDHLHLDAVVTEERAIRVRALMSLKNKERQSLRVRLPEGASVTFLSVAGERERISRGGEGDPRVKLINLSAVRGREEAFLIKILYDIVPDNKGMEALEVFDVGVPEILGEPGQEDAPPVSRLTLDLHLPKDYRYLSFGSDSLTVLHRRHGIWERIRDYFLGGQDETDAPSDLAQSVKHLKTEAAKKKALGEPDFTITKNKRRVRFYKLAGNGRVSVTYMSPTMFQVLNLLFLAAAVAALVFLPFYDVAGRTQLLLLFAAASLLVSALSESLTPFMGTVFIGTLLSAVFWMGYYILVELPKAWPKGSAPPAPPRRPPGKPSPDTEEPPARPPSEPLEGDAPAKKTGKEAEKPSAGAAAPRKTSERKKSAGAKKAAPKKKSSGRQASKKSSRKSARKSGRGGKKGGAK